MTNSWFALPMSRAHPSCRTAIISLPEVTAHSFIIRRLGAIQDCCTDRSSDRGAGLHFGHRWLVKLWYRGEVKDFRLVYSIQKLKRQMSSKWCGFIIRATYPHGRSLWPCLNLGDPVHQSPSAWKCTFPPEALLLWQPGYLHSLSSHRLDPCIIIQLCNVMPQIQVLTQLLMNTHTVCIVVMCLYTWIKENRIIIMVLTLFFPSGTW